MSKTLKFTANPAEVSLMRRIVRRMKLVYRKNQFSQPLDEVSLHMDLSACHASGCPLRLAELLEADDFNFSHDVFGIMDHIDRSTGQLTDCFRPRYAARTEETV